MLWLSAISQDREDNMPEGEVFSLFVADASIDAGDMTESASSCDDVPCNVNCDCYDCVVNT